MAEKIEFNLSENLNESNLSQLVNLRSLAANEIGEKQTKTMAELKKGGSIAIIKNNEVIGYIGFREDKGRQKFVYAGVYLKGDERGKGYGQDLVHELAKEAKKRQHWEVDFGVATTAVRSLLLKASKKTQEGSPIKEFKISKLPGANSRLIIRRNRH